jgi:hypothetical protein
VALLAGPAVLAFRAGGYFDGPRAVAAVAAWALVAAAVLFVARPLPATRPGRAAPAALAALCGWVALGGSWAPLQGPAQDDLVRDLLYLAALLIALMAWRTRAELRRVEPALAAGALVVVGYGLAGRLVPDLVEQRPSASAAGRLEQPLTYWNATGALAAIGLVLCVRLAGDPTRPSRLRACAGAAGVPLATGVYLSFSRGALAALAAGLVVLLLLDWRHEQALAAAVVLGAGVLAAGLAALLPAVESLDGGPGARRGQGAAMLAALVVLGGAAGLALRRLAGSGPARARAPAGRRRAAVAAVGVLALAGVPLAVGAVDGGNATPRGDADPARLRDLSSNRYEYWQVALEAFADRPLRGGGPGSFEVAWQRERDIPEAVSDAHSLYLETAAEQGIVGLLLLAGLLGAVALGGARVLRADPALAAGPVAALTVWAVHAGLDWDWEMPALTLVAVVLAGALLTSGGRLSDLPAG